MKKSSKTIFLDTNILLHYPTIDQIDWQSWCNSKSIKLVVCLNVIDELDRKKDDPQQKQTNRKNPEDTLKRNARYFIECKRNG